jgi:hypothetical protein
MVTPGISGFRNKDALQVCFFDCLDSGRLAQA